MKIFKNIYQYKLHGFYIAKSLNSDIIASIDIAGNVTGNLSYTDKLQQALINHMVNQQHQLLSSQEDLQEDL